MEGEGREVCKVLEYLLQFYEELYKFLKISPSNSRKVWLLVPTKISSGCIFQTLKSSANKQREQRHWSVTSEVKFDIFYMDWDEVRFLSPLEKYAVLKWSFKTISKG